MYSVGGKIVSVGNKVPEKRINTLTFQVSSAQFPDYVFPFNDSRNDAYFDSLGPNSVTVNWGDGIIETFNFGTDGRANPYRIGWSGNGEPTSGLEGNSLAGRHVYQDDNDGLRTITFTFRRLDLINKISFSQARLYGSLPIEIGAADALIDISLSRNYFLEGVPESISDIKSLESFKVSDSFINRLDKIPGGLFNSELALFNVSGSFNLADPISSNLFKINNWKNSLRILAMGNCSISELPISLSECKTLIIAELFKNPIKNPEVLETLFNLRVLYIDCDSFENGLFETTLLTKMETLVPRYMTEDLINEIPLKWTGFKALEDIVGFGNTTGTTFLFQTFIENFYTLCTENGFLDPDSTEAQSTGFPEQFRDISWGDANDWFTVSDPIQAPTGFSLGISNGTPANNAEKIYVLVENYGHSVTLAS
jgi:hypothetical protein